MKKKLIGVGWAALTFVGLSFVLSSCLNSGETFNSQAQLDADVVTIDNFLTTNQISHIKDISGIRMVITKLGTGLPAAMTLTDSVDVTYSGKLFSSGTVFESGTTKGQLQNYIDGWKYALTTLPAGSQASLYIPSPYAYGNQDKGKIPANSILVFDITFNKVFISPKQKAQFTTDTTAINTYMTTKSITPIKDNTGLRYVVTSPTTGPIPSWYDKVKVKYTIKLLSDDTRVIGTIERSPTAADYSRVTDYNIHGIKIGLQRMNAGSKATLYVPSGYGFGASGAVDATGTQVVPPNSPLIVEMEFISFAN